MIALERIGSLREAASGRAVSSGGLRSETLARAGLWAARGVRPGDRVALLQPAGLSFAADLLALWELGACAAPMDPGLPGPELAFLLNDCGARFALRRGPVRGLDDGAPLASGVEMLESPESAEGPPYAQRPAIAAGADALILYTSGTTGGPKGVVHTREGLSSRLDELRREVPAAALLRSLCVLPLHLGHGLIGGLLLPLAAGGEAWLSAPFGLDAGFDLGAMIEAANATFVTGVPALWRAALRVSRPPRPGLLRRVHCASAPLDAELRRELALWAAGAELVDAYGMTETASWISGSAPGESSAGVVGRGWGAQLIVAAPGADSPAVAAAGREGEVWVRSRSLMARYHARPELTARVLRDGWFRTGDRGVMEADGQLRLLGRLDDAINRAGTKVQPDEVEAALARHPDVAEACVFGMPHALAGEIVAAAVVWAPGGGRSFPEIERWCAGRMAEAKVPRRWFALEKLPRTPSGKLRRKEAFALCAAAAAPR